MLYLKCLVDILKFKLGDLSSILISATDLHTRCIPRLGAELNWEYPYAVCGGLYKKIETITFLHTQIYYRVPF